MSLVEGGREQSPAHKGERGNGEFQLLSFRAGGRRYGITVFKVEGVVEAPRRRRLLGALPGVSGIARIRERTVPIVDLAPILHAEAEPESFTNVILTDCDRRLLGFGVGDIDGIVTVRWQEVLRAPGGSGASHVMGVVRTQAGLIQLLEFEEIIEGVAPLAEQALAGEEPAPGPPAGAHTVLVVDDSRLARRRMTQVLDEAGWDVLSAEDGERALALLEALVRDAPDRLDSLRVVVSDVEMPGMDGYTLCQRLRADPRFSRLALLLHTSLSGQFDQRSVHRAAADDFLSKFDAGELARRVHQLAAAAS